MFIRDVETYTQPEDSIYNVPVFNGAYRRACYAMCEQDKHGRFSEYGLETYFLFLFGA